jgi:hypothetical protein
VSRIRGPLELLQHSLPRQSKTLAFSQAGRRLGRQPGPRMRRLLIGLRLLGFDGFALPSPRHFSNYSSRGKTGFGGMHITSARNLFCSLRKWNGAQNLYLLLDGMGIIRGLSERRNVLPFEGEAVTGVVVRSESLNQALRSDNPRLWCEVVFRRSRKPAPPKSHKLQSSPSRTRCSACHPAGSAFDRSRHLDRVNFRADKFPEAGA